MLFKSTEMDQIVFVGPHSVANTLLWANSAWTKHLFLSVDVPRKLLCPYCNDLLVCRSWFQRCYFITILAQSVCITIVIIAKLWQAFILLGCILMPTRRTSSPIFFDNSTGFNTCTVGSCETDLGRMMVAMIHHSSAVSPRCKHR